MTEFRDYYAALESAPGASREMIAEAYERLAKRYQPDPDQPPADPEKMAAIDEAFDVLDDPARREEYDRARTGVPVEPTPGEPSLGEPTPSETVEPAKSSDSSPVIALALIAVGIVAIVIAAGLAIFAVTDDDGGEGGSGSALTDVEETTSTGLGYTDLVVGTGAEAQIGDTVVVHYTGWLEDGTVFDSSVERGVPFDFILGAGEVIAGWDEGILGMQEGGKRKLVIPPDLGYGPTANGPIPANATLIFEVELLEVQ